MAPTATPTMPTPKPTVEMVAWVLSALMSDCSDAGHVLPTQWLSSVDLVPSARPPMTPPRTRPTPPTTNAPMATPRSVAFVDEGGGLVGATAATTVGEGGGAGAAATAFGSTSSFSDTADSPP